MSVEKLASRYAKALLDLSKEQATLERVYQDILSFAQALQNRDFALMVKSPIINASKKRTILKRIFGTKFHEITRRFVDIIIRKRRETYLPEIVSAFIEQYRDYKKVATATLITAVNVERLLLEQVRNIVMQRTGKTSVDLTTKIDPSLIGGFILKFDDKLYDASIASKLNKIRSKFDDNVYVKQY